MFSRVLRLLGNFLKNNGQIFTELFKLKVSDLFDFTPKVHISTTRFVSVALLRPLIVGLLTGLSDGLLKPVLSVGFNSLIQPVAALLYNVGVALKLIVAPLADSVSLILTPIGHLLRSFRLVEIHRHPPSATV